MPETRWTLRLDAKGAAQARAMARDVRDLDASLRALGESSGNLSRASNDSAALRSTRVRVRAERAYSDRVAREQRRVRTEIEDSEMVRRAVGRSRDRYDRLQAAESTSRVRRQQRVEQLAARDSVAVGQRSARQNALAFRASQRQQERAILGRARTERASAERVARLNAAAFRRNNQADTNRVLANDRARARAAQRAARESSGGLGLGVGLGAFAAVVAGITAATASALETVVSMASAVGGLVFNISRATLEMIAFREASLTTLRAMARDSSGRRLTGAAADREARGQYRFAQEFARQTPLDTAQVLDLQRQTSAAGFSGSRNREVVQAAADVGAFNPNDPSAASRFLLGLGQLRNASTVRLQDLRQTSQAAGLGENDILREIARNAGMTQRAGESETAYNTRIQRAQQSGRFTGAQGVEGVLAALRTRNGGELGSFARSQGGTLTGTLSNLRGAILDFVTSIEDIENLPGIKALKKTLNEVVGVLTGAGPVAMRLRATFAGIVNEVAGFAGGLGGKTGVEGIITQVLDVAQDLWPLIREFAMVFKDNFIAGFMESMGPLLAMMSRSPGSARGWLTYMAIFGHDLGRISSFMLKVTAAVIALIPALTALLDVIVEVIEAFAEAPERLREWLNPDEFRSMGEDIVNGTRDGFRGPAYGFLSEVRSWGRDIAAASRDSLEIHSPSRVFEDIGAQIPAGMQRGIEGGAPGVDNAVRGLGAPQGGPGAGRSLTGVGGTGNLTVNATFHFHFSGVDLSGGNAADVGRMLGESTWSSFVESIEATHQGGG